MTEFLETIAGYPTAIWTTLLVVMLLYWLMVSIGMLDMDFGGADIDMDVDAELSGISGLLATFGLHGVPLPLVVTLLTANAWILSYFGSHFFMPDAAVLAWLIGTAVLVASLVLAIPATSIQIKPLRKLFRKSVRKPLHLAIQGATCSIRSSRCDADFGEANVSYEGASLVVKVRALGDPLAKGDSAVVVKHDAETNIFLVVSEKEFQNN